MNALDEAIVRATQAGLPLVAEPWRAVARACGVPEPQLFARVEAMLHDGRIRRIGAVPNHYALGYTANAMSVWDVADDAVEDRGRVGLETAVDAAGEGSVGGDSGEYAGEGLRRGRGPHGKGT